MAEKPDGAAANTKRVSFTKSSADRIAKVVRDYEGGDRDQLPFGSGPRIQDRGGSQIRTAIFTGAWNQGDIKNISWKYKSGTANCYNDLVNLPNSGSRNCIVGKEGTAWRLINWQWYIANAATAAELTTTALRFHTLPTGALATSGTVIFTVSVASCSTATT